MKLLPPLYLFLLMLSAGCQSTLLLSPEAPKTQALYQDAIESSMSPAPDKVYKNLVAITPENPNLIRKTIEGEEYILVVTWKQSVQYYEPYLDSGFYNTGKYPIWVTTAPELLERMKREKTQQVDRRLQQLFGLPPTAEYKYFVEFWVRPQDLFRPCPDAEITDKECGLCFPEKADSLHTAWVNSLRLDSYYGCELYRKYPWTQLGYTYDWNARNKSHVGLSEFVIGADKNLKVAGIYTTEEYLRKEVNP